MEKKRVHVWIRGRVQGVYFRAYARDSGCLIGVKGWVRNLPDGRVEAVFEGEPHQVDEMIEWCRNGSPLSRVEALDIEYEICTNEFKSFSILH